MTFPNHIAKSDRMKVGLEWGKRSAIARQRIRSEQGVDAETLRYRALHDARGSV